MPLISYEFKINFVKSFLKSQQADNELSIAGFAKQQWQLKKLAG